jgi:ABC-2 type transport system ATP-binding protein
VASDTPENLSRQLGHGSRIGLVVKGPPTEVASALKNVAGVKDVVSAGEDRFLVQGQNGGDLRPELARLVVHQGWQLLELKAQEFTLEEVFLNLVTEEEASAS